MRRSSRFCRVLVLILLGCLLVALLAGCDNVEESAYKDKVRSINSRWNQAVGQFKKAGDNSKAQLKAVTTISDPYQALAALRAALESFLQQIQQFLAQIEGFQVETNQLQPPAKFVTEHKILVNG
ncbi:MAG: hypothetical protein ACYC99_12430, partial [Candidatus Geothermincolia bacterium]